MPSFAHQRHFRILLPFLLLPERHATEAQTRIHSTEKADNMNWQQLISNKRFGLPMEGYTYYFTYEETLPHRKRDYWQMACALGGDLSQGDDFCSFTFLFPLRNGSFGVKTRNYITSRTLNKLPAAMRNKYEQFMDEGSLVVLDGTVLDPMQVYEDLDEYIVACGYDVRCFGYDPRYEARY